MFVIIMDNSGVKLRVKNRSQKYKIYHPLDVLRPKIDFRLWENSFIPSASSGKFQCL